MAPLPTGVCTVRTSLDKTFIRHAIGEQRAALSTCYEQFLERHPDSHDELRAHATFTIVHDGHVSLAEVSLPDAQLGACLCNVVAGFHFPALPPRAGSVVVHYPFVFTPPE